MKNNVDLTSDKLFSTGGLRVIDKMIKEISGRFPWSLSFKPVYNDESLNEYWDGENLILTGTYSDRQRKSTVYDIVEGLTCDRCGVRLDKKPWDTVYCLCGDCHEALKVDLNKKVFRIDESYGDLINRSNDRVVIELNYRNPIGG